MGSDISIKPFFVPLQFLGQTDNYVPMDIIMDYFTFRFDLSIHFFRVGRYKISYACIWIGPSLIEVVARYIYIYIYVYDDRRYHC